MLPSLFRRSLVIKGATVTSSSLSSRFLFSLPLQRSYALSSSDAAKLIIYEDNHLLAVAKPNGILSQSDFSSDKDLLTLMKEYLKTKYAKPGDVYLGLVHRLDRPCSGVLVFAKTSKAAARLSESFRERKVLKRYLCIVEGRLEGEGECVDLFQRMDGYRNQKSRLVKPSSQFSSSSTSSDAVEARLSYKAIQQLTWRDSKGERREASLVDIVLGTGRKHQIRLQLANIGHPILGDLKYGAKEGFPLSKSIYLHAYLLSFFHPTTQKKVVCSSLL